MRRGEDDKVSPWIQILDCPFKLLAVSCNVFQDIDIEDGVKTITTREATQSTNSPLAEDRKLADSDPFVQLFSEFLVRL